VTSIAKPSSVWHLSPSEIDDHRKDGKCKQLFTIKAIEESDKLVPPLTTANPTISLHVLTGIQPRTTRTMQVTVHINGTQLTALLDSNSMHNFEDTGAVERAGLHLT
jgi:hypothetical protein